MCCSAVLLLRHFWTIFGVALFLFWSSFLTSFGVYSLGEEPLGAAGACANRFHLFKYGFVNVMFMIGIIFSYFLWKGGGEGARARATLVMILHFGLGMWGALIWSRMDSKCVESFSDAYWRTLQYQRMCTLSNLTFFLLYAVHEAILGEYVQADLTLFIELVGCGQKGMNDYPYALQQPQAPAQDHSQMSPGATITSPGSPGMQPVPDPPPHSPPQLSGLP